MTAKPFDDFRTLLATLPPADAAAETRVRTLFAKADKPNASLGRIEDVAAWLAAWSGRAPPALNRPLVAIFAGNHGAVRRLWLGPAPATGWQAGSGRSRKDRLCAEPRRQPSRRTRRAAQESSACGLREWRRRL
ncbi:MAG: nicotinate-nucleotide--dimethylbenzimidazole phosphoribosyltransferase, partial [Mesorhizobium sp.]